VTKCDKMSSGDRLDSCSELTRPVAREVVLSCERNAFVLSCIAFAITTANKDRTLEKQRQGGAKNES
jgi:hypothetical protein